MYIFWNFAFLPIWPLPMSVFRIYKTVGILLEVFVNPLNMVNPLWVGVLLPLLVFLIGASSLARRSWPASLVFVVPIVLAMIASAMQRYPFHGRLVLELVPAFFILIGMGMERLRDGTTGRAAWGYKLLLVLLLGYPCLMGVYEAAFTPARTTERARRSAPEPVPANRPQPAAAGASAVISQHRDVDAFASVHRRVVSAEADHGPVGGCGGVGQSRALALQGAQERVDEVGMRAAVAAALEE